MVAVWALFGAALLPVAWLAGAYERYEARELASVDARVIAGVAAGSGVLAVYAFTIRDLPFLVAHLALAMFAATELGLLMHVRGGR